MDFRERQDDNRCAVQVDLGQRCDNPATMTVHEPYTPASFKIECCETCGKDLLSQGYLRDLGAAE